MTQTGGTVTVPEGKPGLLNCTYATSGSPALFWYVQYPHEAPRLLLAEYEATEEEEERKRRRGFSAKHERNPISFHLKKNSSEASDSAVYYCALSDTVTDTPSGAAQKPHRVADLIPAGFSGGEEHSQSAPQPRCTRITSRALPTSDTCVLLLPQERIRVAVSLQGTGDFLGGLTWTEWQA